MDERVMQFRVGVMFLATFIITGILLVMFGKLPRWIGSYPVQVRFEYAGGVSKGAPVRKSGILIGRVADVQLTEADSKVLVTLDIQNDKTVYQNEECYITRDLLGDTAVVFAPVATSRAPRKPIEPNSVLEGQISDDPTGLKKALEGPINTVNNTGQALAAASEQLGRAAHRVEEILDDETQKNVQSLLRDAAVSLKSIQSILGDEQNREKITQAMKRLPETIDNMNTTFQATNDTLHRFTDRTGPDKKSPIDRMVSTIEITERTLRKFSEPAREGELAPVDQIAKAMENINDVTSVLRTVMNKIDQGEGSIGALMNDRELYNRLNRAARNIEDISRQLKPVVADARVITDKVARHPGVIIRDAVKPGVGIK